MCCRDALGAVGMYSPVPGLAQGPGLPKLSRVPPEHWLQAWLAQESEGHMAGAGQLRLVLRGHHHGPS